MKRRKQWEIKQKCREEKEQYNTRTPCIFFLLAEDYNQTEETSFVLYYTVLYGEARTAFHENDNTNSNRKDEQEKEDRKMEICRSVSPYSIVVHS